MAAGAISAAQGQVVCETPFLIRRWENMDSENETVVVTHGEDRSPDLVFVGVYGSNPTGSEVSLVSRTTSATTFTLDCEADSKKIYVIAVWFSQASGGLTNVA